MIKVLLVVCNNVLNGTERYVVDLAKNLPKDKFDVTIATPMTGPLSRIILEKGVKEVIYENNKLLYYTPVGLWNLYKIIKKNKFHIVHANAKFFPCLLGKLAGVKLNIETKHGIFYTKEQLKNLPKWRYYYERFKQYFADKIIAISDNDKDTLINHFDIKRNKIVVIYNGLDFDDFRIKTKMIKSNDKEIKDKFVIGNIGRLTFQKAQDTLLIAFKLLTERYNNLELILVGIGEDEKKIKDFVYSNDLVSKIKFKGYSENIYQELSKFSALVMTSRFEGTPYVIFEAMAMGIPVVSTRVGGIDNILKNGTDAILTNVDDPTDTMKAIEKLMTDTILSKSIKDNALIKVSKYTAERMCNLTSELYTKYL